MTKRRRLSISGRNIELPVMSVARRNSAGAMSLGSRRSSGSSMGSVQGVARQLAPQLAAYAMNAIAPQLATPIRAAGAIYNTFRRNSAPPGSIQRMQRGARRQEVRRGFGGVSTGVYRGRFAKPKRVKAKKVGRLTDFLSRGVVEYNET